MTPEQWNELRELFVHVWRNPDDIASKEYKRALALIDAVLALHSTAKIAGAGAGEVCRWAPRQDGEGYTPSCVWACGRSYVARPLTCPDCGKRVEVRL